MCTTNFTMARLRSAPKAQERSPLKEKTNTMHKAPRAQPNKDKGDRDGSVKTRKKIAGRMRKGLPNNRDIAIADGSESQDGHPSTTDELAKTDAPTLQTVRARPSLVGTQTSHQKAMEPVVTVERSGLSISPSPPPPGRLSSIRRDRSSLDLPGSEFRSHATPAVESSVLKHFKRRPRQPSMLQMVAQHHASARPSAVNRTAGVDDPSIFDLLDDEDMFAPDAEGTPMQTHKKRNSFVQTKQMKRRAPIAATDSSLMDSKKRRPDEANMSSSSLNVSNTKRRRAGPAPPVSDGKLNYNITLKKGTTRSSSIRQTTPLRAPASDIQVLNSSPSHTFSTPPTEPSLTGQVPTNAAQTDSAIPSTENEQLTIHHLTTDADLPRDIMAEPVSSSPEPFSPIVVRSQLVQSTELSTQAEPLTPMSPSPEKNQTSGKIKRTRPVSTATLQSMLPKRRQPKGLRHRKSEYDVSSGPEDEIGTLDASHLEEDEDELGGRLRRQTKPRISATLSTQKNKVELRPPAKHRASKSQQKTMRKLTAPTKGPVKTYGRAGHVADAAEKENEPYNPASDVDEDITDLPEVSMDEVAHSKELEEAKRKFADIDQWDMEFESISTEDHRSSSQSWR